MTSIERLSPDQRAVLELVLRRGRSFQAIARALSLDPAAVRERALAALDALGPQIGLAAERRARIAEYLLGQLPAEAAARAREQIAGSPAERAWARVVAAELAPLASAPLPEIPAAAGAAPTPPPQISAGADAAPSIAVRDAAAPPSPAAASGASAHLSRQPSEGAGEPASAGQRARPSSRRGGAILLGSGALIAAAAIVLVLVVFAGSSGKRHQRPAANGQSAGAGAAASRSATTSPAGGAQEVAAARLSSPRGSKAAGAAEVIRAAGKLAIVLVATGVPANTAHNFYAVWLANGAGSYYRLGFVKPPVKQNGRLETAGGLPSSIAAHLSEWKQLIVSLETSANPSKPGDVVLQGTLIFA